MKNFSSKAVEDIIEWLFYTANFTVLDLLGSQASRPPLPPQFLDCMSKTSAKNKI